MAVNNTDDKSLQERQASTTNNTQQGQPVQNPSVDERDQKIKNEPDTRRLRSERQSVIDGEQDNNNA